MYGGLTSIGAFDTGTFRFGREGYAERATTRLNGITANIICERRQAAAAVLGGLGTSFRFEALSPGMGGSSKDRIEDYGQLTWVAGLDFGCCPGRLETT